MTVDDFLEAVRREDISPKTFYIEGQFLPDEPGYIASNGYRCFYRTMVVKEGAGWRVNCPYPEQDVFLYDERFTSQSEALDYAWQKVYCDLETRNAVRRVLEEIKYQTAALHRRWEKRLPLDEVYALMRDKERELQPTLDAARDQYAKPVCDDG